MERDEIKNPLLMPDILDETFKLIVSPTLLKYRGVSGNWNDMVKSVLRRRGNNPKIKLGYDVKDETTMLKHLRKHSNAVALEFPSVRLVDASDNTAKHQEVVMKISEIFGTRKTVKHLEIYIPDSDIEEEFEDADTSEFEYPTFKTRYFGTILRHLSPSLETLKISFSSKCVDHIVIPEELSSWEEINFQNLRTIELNLGQCMQVSNFTSLLRIVLKSSPKIQDVKCGSEDLIPLFMETGRLGQIENILLGHSESLDMLLNSDDLGMKSLQIWPYDGPLDSLKIKQLLQTQQMTLKSLKFQCHSEFTPAVTLPVLKSLTYLHLQLPYESNKSFIRNLNFGLEASNLKELFLQCLLPIGEWKDALHYTENKNGPPCKSLEILDIMFHIEDPNCCNYLAKVFPSIKTLRINGAENDFQKRIWKLWPSLEELSVANYFGNDFDDILFGITKDWKQTIDVKQVEWWGNVIVPEREESDITNLKGLKRVKIHGEGIDITDFSLYLGFARMKGLEELEILGSFEINTNAVEYLQSKFPNCKMNIRRISMFD